MRKLSTILMRVYNSEHYKPENTNTVSTGNVSGYLCNATDHAVRSGLIAFDEGDDLRRAIRQRLDNARTLSEFLLINPRDSKSYVKAAMKFWRGWRRELQAAGK